MLWLLFWPDAFQDSKILLQHPRMHNYNWWNSGDIQYSGKRKFHNHLQIDCLSASTIITHSKGRSITLQGNNRRSPSVSVAEELCPSDSSNLYDSDTSMIHLELLLAEVYFQWRLREEWNVMNKLCPPTAKGR